MRDDDIARVRRIAGYRWRDIAGHEADFLTEDEVKNLTIRAGTLTDDERKIINHHIVATIKMLEALPWPKHLTNVPEYAGGHHERMDGKGYPKGLTREQMSVQARCMGIADIFEALTAKDRPYKKGKTLSESHWRSSRPRAAERPRRPGSCSFDDIFRCATRCIRRRRDVPPRPGARSIRSTGEAIPGSGLAARTLGWFNTKEAGRAFADSLLAEILRARARRRASACPAPGVPSASVNNLKPARPSRAHRHLRPLWQRLNASCKKAAQAFPPTASRWAMSEAGYRKTSIVDDGSARATLVRLSPPPPREGGNRWAAQAGAAGRQGWEAASSATNPRQPAERQISARLRLARASATETAGAEVPPPEAPACCFQNPLRQSAAAVEPHAGRLVAQAPAVRHRLGGCCHTSRWANSGRPRSTRLRIDRALSRPDRRTYNALRRRASSARRACQTRWR